jgi:hypothetical protein
MSRPSHIRRLVPATFAACALAALLVLAGCGGGTPDGLVGPTEAVGPNGPIGWSEAQTRVGERLTAEGPVTTVSETGGEVVLDVGAEAPDPSRLVVVIPAAARGAFPADAETAYLDKLIRVRGTIEDRDGVATIVVEKPADLKVE